MSCADEDPEQRIAELERPLLPAATGGEQTSRRLRTGLMLGWIALGVMIVALVVGGRAILADRDTVSGRPTMVGGGATVTDAPATPTPSGHSSAGEVAPPAPSLGSPAPVSTPPPGQAVSVAGVGNDRTIACTGNEVSISGVDNTVVLTGHCGRVDVSGVKNVVTIEAADAIVVSGMNNAVTFRSGAPQVSNSGIGNTLGQS